MGPATLAAPRWSEIAEVLRTGVQIAVATIAEVGIFLGATLFAATLGPADVAAHAVAIRAAGVAYALPTGLLQATLVRTSRAGALCVRMQCEANGSGRALGLAAGGGLFLLFTAAAFVPHHLVDAAPGRNLADIASSLLLLVALIQLYDAPGAVAAGILRGRSDTRAPMIFTLAGYWGISAPLGVWLATAREMGVVGIWIGLATGTAVASLLMLARVRQLWRSA